MHLVNQKTNSIFSRVIKSTSTLTVGRIVNALCSFAYIPWATESIGLTAYGQLILLTTFIAFSANVTSLQAGGTLIQYGSDSFHKKDYHSFYKILAFCIRLECLSGLIGIFVCWFSITFFGQFFFKGHVELYSLATYFMFVIPFINPTWQGGLIQLLNKYRLLTLLQLSGTAIRTLGYFIGYEYNCNMLYFLVIWCIIELTGFFLFTGSVIYLIKYELQTHFPWKELFSSSIHAKGIWNFTFFATLNNLIYTSAGQTVTLIVSSIVSAEDLAILSVARRIMSAAVRPFNLMLAPLYPELIKLRDNKDWHALRSTFFKVFYLVGAVGITLPIFSSFLGPYILSFMLSHPAPSGSITLLNIIAISFVFSVATSFLNPLFTIFNELEYITKTKITVFILHLPLLVWLTHAFGIHGAAIAGALEWLGILILYLYKVIRFKRLSFSLN